MLNNLNSTIITPLSPKNQKDNESKFIHNDFCNDISPEFLNSKNKKIKKYIHNSTKQQNNNDTSNFLLFTPADIRQHNNISINSTYNEIDNKTSYGSNTDVSNFSTTTSTYNDFNQNSNLNNKSYSVDTFSSNELIKNYEYSIENNLYLKNFTDKTMNKTLINNNTLSSQTNTLFNNLNGNGELSNTFLNYNLLSTTDYLFKNGNNNTIKNDKIYKNVNNLLEFEEKNLNNFNLNSNIFNQKESNSICNTNSLSTLFSNYQSRDNLNLNSIPLSNITNTSTLGISNINSTKGLDPSLTLKRKLPNTDSDDETNNIYQNKKLRTSENKVLEYKTIHLINKINEPTSIDNKLQYNNYAKENKSTISENVDISLKGNNNNF
ncbi:hypothetical protein PIROE2DRAFT_7776 [Piromyces sp. E2]|nr:hypothetical protein PIROE2DRAFT_7776 [Piromyces sp. E2]|eukprot:OUM65236.1 hypothetical protein PIROE2DRAFT_7776 [Piromyces sp. E2]